MAHQSIPVATIEQFALRATLAKRAWSTYISDLDIVEQASRLEQAFKAQGLRAVSKRLPTNLRTARRSAAPPDETTVLILIAEGASAEEWNEVDVGRSLVESGRTVLLVTPDSAEALMRGAPHVTSYIGGSIWRSAASGNEVLNAPPGTTRMKPASGRGDFGASASWLRENKEKYANSWVALRGDLLIDNDRSRLRLQERLSEYPDLNGILVVHVDGDS